MISASDREKPVLIVLDDAPLAALVHRVIDDAGFRPFVARDAREARDLMGKGLDPCVVLLALHGAAEGRDFIARHTAEARTAGIPVIFFTPRAATSAEPVAPIVAALVAFVQTYCGESARDGGTIVH